MYAIKTAEAQDLKPICTLLEECELPFSDLAADHIAGFLVVRQGPAVLACIGLEVAGEDGLLRSLAVQPMERGAGFGPRMVSAMEEQARRRGLCNLYLLTTTAADFFERQGYRRLDRAHVPDAVRATPQFSSICPSTAVCLWKPLAESQD